MPISLVAPPPTPFDEKGNIKLTQIDKLAAHLRRSGVTGVFLCGSTGEGMSLSIGERKEISEAWSEVAPAHELKTIAQIGANSQRDAIELARHAAGLELDAVSAHAPCYFRPKTVDQLISFFAPIANSAGDTPFYFYDIPQLTGVDLPTDVFLRHATQQIPTLAGVKFTNPNLALLQKCLREENGRYKVFFGCDEALVAGYCLGARSAIGSTYNFMAPVAHRIIQAFDGGNFEVALSLQSKIVETVDILAEYGYLGAAKVVMEFFDIDCGVVREPLESLNRKQKDKIIQRLTAIGFPFDEPAVVETDGAHPTKRGVHWNHQTSLSQLNSNS